MKEERKRERGGKEEEDEERRGGKESEREEGHRQGSSRVLLTNSTRLAHMAWTEE